MLSKIPSLRRWLFSSPITPPNPIKYFCAASNLQKTEINNVQEKSLENINFEDYRNVFKNKTSWELMRGLVILRLCSINAIVDNSLEVRSLPRDKNSKC